MTSLRSGPYGGDVTEAAMNQVIHPQAEESALRPVKLPEGAGALETDRVYVVYTTLSDTLAAVRAADALAKPLGVPVTVIDFRTASHARPVDQPGGVSPIESESFTGHLYAGGMRLDARVIQCRDERAAIAQAFKSPSLIVIGGRCRWWPTPADKWRHLLESAGHHVVFVDTEKSHA